MTYTWEKVKPTNGPELQAIALEAFRRTKRIPFCLGGTMPENVTFAQAYSNFKHVHLLRESDELVGLIYGNTFFEGNVECVELSVIDIGNVDAKTVLTQYRETLPENIKVYISEA